MSTVISVENLSKAYQLGQIGTGTLTNDLKLWWAKARGKPNPLLRIGESDHGNRSGETIWALKDVSFEVQQGEALGVIGRNGAGKSTLLKVLSRITAPTSGRVRVKGRIASLLEVGTGFHPELTGRENIYLNGAILGMRRDEVRRKFDEIVDFAGIAQFVDTPVKRYSSGMYVRLAFAVAAHLEPEILLVDEVLAVGDIAFQNKCVKKMEDIAGERKTILFVSHNLPMIRKLCPQAILIEKGKIIKIGQAEQIISMYINNINDHITDIDALPKMVSQLPPDPIFKLIDISIGQNGYKTNILGNGEPIEVAIVYHVYEEISGFRVFFDLIDKNETLLFRTFHDNGVETIPIVKPGTYISRVLIPANFLSPITYFLQVQATIHNVRLLIPSVIRIPVFVQDTGIVNRAYVGDPIRGKLSPMLEWNTSIVNTNHLGDDPYA